MNLPAVRMPAFFGPLWKRDTTLSFEDWIQMIATFSYQGVQYALPGAKQEAIGGGYAGLGRSAFKSNGVVFACIQTRMLLFSEARFQFRRLNSAPAQASREMRAGQLFGTTDLGLLEEPWPGATTGDLLTRMLLSVDLGGNAFVVREDNGRLTVLRPDWVTMLIGSQTYPDAGAWDPTSEVLAYSYKPGGPGSPEPPIVYDAAKVAHFAPIPDPESAFRGMSWLTPLIREVMADKATTDHKLAFLENGAVRNQIIKLDTDDLEVYRNWIDAFKAEHAGSAANKFKTIFLGAGADATTVGVDMRELDFKVIQAAGETRIAAAAGVPPVIVGLSEGLASATYSNYSQARRRFADGTLRPMWRNAAGSLAKLINVPGGAELWYDTRDISFLREDEKDAAEITQMNAVAAKTLVDAGFDPDSVIQAVESGDFSKLSHTGLVSVQLQEPGAQQDAAPPALPGPASNGSSGSRKDTTHVEFPDGRVLTVSHS